MVVPTLRVTILSLSLVANSLAGPVSAPEPSATYDPGRSLAPLVRAVEPAVVAIEVEGLVERQRSPLPPEFRDFFGPLMQDADPGPRRVRGEGSGFVISADGLLVTNHHVVHGASVVRARFSTGETIEAELLASDPTTDIALLQLPQQRAWTYVEFGDSDSLEVGDWVVAVGNPLGLGTTVTAGIISGKGRSLGNNPYDEFIQTDAAINQGNSGGPLFDLNGRVVGVNSAIIKYANTVGFSIPSGLVQRVIEDLRQSGEVRRGFIGVSLQDPDPALAEALGLPHRVGALITQVHDGHPAAEAGLRPGDVVREVEGVEVIDSASLIRIIGKHRPGEKVKLGIWRDGRDRHLTVRLDSKPEPRASRDQPRITTREQPKHSSTFENFGFSVRPNAARNLERPELVITSIDPAGPAMGRLQVGDRLLAINRSNVETVEEAEEALAAGGSAVILEVERGAGRHFVALSPRRSAKP
ncbi:MAG: PDZ domain-containing protein [Deltaproteobacteria bacterium]|nr:MAG: PDZ domain-containing protein [Deltaproteobacteria bacterium]